VKAFITGVTGQDGFYLSEWLQEIGYTVYGLVRRSSQSKSIPKGIRVIEGDVTDPLITKEIFKIQPDEIYHLAAMSHVGESFKIPNTTFQINAVGTLNLLEAAKACGSRFYQASTSELFGTEPAPQNENTPFHPRSPYGVSKLAAYWLTVNYREAYGLNASNGILFNHESPLRGKDFITQKVVTAAVKISLGLQKNLILGNLDAKRDWGHAKDYVKGMWLILQKPADDYVLATGKAYSVEYLVNYVFSSLNLNWKDYVLQDERFMRPSEIPELKGDPSKAEKIGWEREYTFHSMIDEMIEYALSRNVD